jgi:hypothetical protein
MAKDTLLFLQVEWYLELRRVERKDSYDDLIVIGIGCSY